MQRGWRLLTRALGWCNSRLLLSLVYLLVLMPLAWFYRLRQRDPLFLHHKAERYFQVLDKQYTGQDLEEMW